MARKKSRKHTAFVPTVVFGTAVLGVIPVCALGCGGQDSSGKSSNDAAASPNDASFSPDQFLGGVGYCAFCTVAAIGFDAGSGPVDDAGADAADASGSDGATLTCPPACTVGIAAFDGSLDSEPPSEND